MDLPVNHFKQALAEGRQQIGLWNTLPGSFAAEALATTGFDWVLIDTEHSPAEVLDTLPSLQAIAAYPSCSAVVRPAANDPVLIKRFLDLGAQTLLIPYVQSVEEARAAVQAVRYPPAGIRGVAGMTRATRFGKLPGYASQAQAQLCLLVQLETLQALEQIEAVAAVDGVDGIFIGPSDLAASMGHAGQPAHPAVVAAVEDAIRRIVAAGKPAGILTLNPVFAQRCVDLGTTFTAVGMDLAILVQGATDLATRFRA